MGDLRPIDLPPLKHPIVQALVQNSMNDRQRQDYEEQLEVDFSFEIQGLARFRVNAFHQQRGAAAVFRVIPLRILTLDELGAPKVFEEIIDVPRGLVLVTGPTGSGKSTTLAAMIDYFNHRHSGHSAHILTIEDPIEGSGKYLNGQRRGVH